MEKNLVIGLNKVKYLVVDTIDSNNVTYYSTVILDKLGKATTTYAVLKKYLEDNKEVIIVVNDDRELADVLNAFAEKAIADMTNALPKVGSIIGVADRDFVILAYVPYLNDMYVVLMTKDEPYEAMIARIEGDITDGEFSIKNMSDTEEGNVVLQIYRLIHGNK